MLNISKILESLSNKHTQAVVIRGAVAELINKETNMSAKGFDIALNTGTITVKTNNAMARNELFIKKQKILDEIKKQFPNQNISELVIR